jgi:Asp/Glu/hydantoin racemase
MGSLGLIHTVPLLIEVFKKLCADILPGVQVMHVLDEPLLKMVQQNPDSKREQLVKRLKDHVFIAKEAGADAVLVTCSSVSPLVDDIRDQCSIPVFKIDDAMVAEAVRRGSRIGVVATALTTLEPTRQALEQFAKSTEKKIEVRTVFVEDALQSLMQGEGALHDRKVKDAVKRLSKLVEVVVLAQASMARVLNVFPNAEREVPVLTSPHLALEKVKSYL